MDLAHADRPMNPYMVVARFIPGTDMAEVLSVVREEQARVAELTAEGRLGALRVSMPRRTVFLEAFGADGVEVEATVRSLPMARWWTLDIYPTPAAMPSATM